MLQCSVLLLAFVIDVLIWFTVLLIMSYSSALYAACTLYYVICGHFLSPACNNLVSMAAATVQLCTVIDKFIQAWDERLLMNLCLFRVGNKAAVACGHIWIQRVGPARGHCVTITSWFHGQQDCNKRGSRSGKFEKTWRE